MLEYRGVFTGTQGYAKSVAVKDGYAYVADDEMGLAVVDVRVRILGQVRQVSWADTPGNALDVAVDGDYAFVADGVEGLAVFRIDGGETPVKVAQLDLSAYSRSLVVARGWALLCAADGGVHVVDVRDPEHPVYAGLVGTSYATDLCISRRRARPGGRPLRRPAGAGRAVPGRRRHAARGRHDAGGDAADGHPRRALLAGRGRRRLLRHGRLLPGQARRGADHRRGRLGGRRRGRRGAGAGGGRAPARRSRSRASSPARPTTSPCARWTTRGTSRPSPTHAAATTVEGAFLRAGGVAPALGDPATVFAFRVTFVDDTDAAPLAHDVTIDGAAHAMTLESGSPAAGAVYLYETALPAGAHQHAFAFVDALDRPVTLAAAAGPFVGSVAFAMGSPAGEVGRLADEVLHDVLLSAAPVAGAREVTQAAWNLRMPANPSTFVGDELPVHNVTWLEAVEYCNLLSAGRGAHARLHDRRAAGDVGPRGRRLAPADGVRVGVPLPRRHDHVAVQRRARRAGLRRGSPARGGRLVLRQRGRRPAGRGPEAAQRPGPVRRARQRARVVLGLVRPLPAGARVRPRGTGRRRPARGPRRQLALLRPRVPLGGARRLLPDLGDDFVGFRVVRNGD